MRLAFLCFLLGSTLAAGALAFDDVARFALVLGVALPVWKDGGPRVRAFPPRPALLFAAAAAAGAFAAGSPPLSLLAQGVAAIAGARLLRSLLLFAGVPKAPRLHLFAALVAGAAVSWSCFHGVAGETLLYLGAALCAIAFALAAETVADAGCLAPDHERLLAGWPATFAAIALGLATTATWMVVAGQAPAVRFAPAALAAGAFLVPLANPSLRRSGLALGAASLLAVGAIGAALRWVPALALALPALLAGAALPVLPRFYAGIPRGLMLLADIDPADRPVLDGAVLRTGALLIGAALAPFALAAVAPDLKTCLVAQSIAGAAAIVFDPRAGIGEKLLQLVAAGAAATAGIAALPE